jgi:putative glutamine amidotransferase
VPVHRDGARSPLVGLTADLGRGANGGRLTLPYRYVEALAAAGALPVILPVLPSSARIAQTLRRLSGIVVTGGSFDIDPARFGERRSRFLGRIDRPRTEFELRLIALALARDMPVLGICGGEQAINVALGGSLFQDILRQIPGAREHESRRRRGHRVRIVPGTRLHRIVGAETLAVNTSHHQSVKALGRGLVVNATAPDGVIEGIESSVHSFVLGVQWHPERLTRDPRQRRIFSAFVAACARA